MTALVKTREINTVEQLVIRAQNGDRSALGELFEQFERTVFAIAFRRLGDTDEAEELTQEVFIQTMTKLDQLRVPAAFPGWLKTLATRMAINRVVRRKVTVSLEPDLFQDSIASDRTPLCDLLDAERKTEVRDSMALLREMDRETLHAFYVDGKSLNEMCDQFDAPLGTIKRRLHTARQRLAKQMEAVAV